MKDSVTPILDAAEKRMRMGGLSAFSHREIAADVGVKSSSVHYHFPTKDNLAAAVIRRYRERASAKFDAKIEAGQDAAAVLKEAFHGTVYSESRMCPCTLLGASALGLPPEVALEVKLFYKMCLDKLTDSGMPLNGASEFLSAITGAIVLAAALDDRSIFDHATDELEVPRSVA